MGIEKRDKDGIRVNLRRGRRVMRECRVRMEWQKEKKEDIDVSATEIGKIKPISDFGLRLRLEILQREVRILTF